MVRVIVTAVAVLALGLKPALAAEVSYFDVPHGAHPHDVAPAPDGVVWYTAQSQGAIGILAAGLVLLGLLFNFNGMWVNIGWALCAAWLARRVAAVQRGMHWLQRAAGVMFIGFGLRLALSDNPSH